MKRVSFNLATGRRQAESIHVPQIKLHSLDDCLLSFVTNIEKFKFNLRFNYVRLSRMCQAHNKNIREFNAEEYHN